MIILPVETSKCELMSTSGWGKKNPSLNRDIYKHMACNLLPFRKDLEAIVDIS